MNAHMYMRSHTPERVKEVCDLAKTKPSWFDLCARGHGKFSVAMAIDLEAASKVYAELPDDYMTVEELFCIDETVKNQIVTFRNQLIKKHKAA